jgi:pyrroline-5-carboxylate reductase
MSAKITFIGGGNMAGAIIAGMISSSAFAPSQITVSEPAQERCDQVALQFPGINTTTSNITAVSSASLVLIAGEISYS